MSLDINIIRESFEKAKPIANDVVDKFYELLFEDFPAVVPLFETVDMAVQKKALLGSLVFTVDHLDNEEKLTDFLFNLGARHSEYGTEEAHYPAVAQTLLKTFAHFFGDDWTEELEEQWTLALNFIASVMIEGQRSKVPEIGTIKDKARQICEGLLEDTMKDAIDEEFMNLARKQVRRVLMEVLKEEAEHLVTKSAA